MVAPSYIHPETHAFPDCLLMRWQRMLRRWCWCLMLINAFILGSRCVSVDGLRVCMLSYKKNRIKWSLGLRADMWIVETYNGLLKKKCQLSCPFVFCPSLLLFYSDMVHKQWLKVWCLTFQVPVPSGRINSDLISTTSNFFAPKISMKFSKKVQNFLLSFNTLNGLFDTC